MTSVFSKEAAKIIADAVEFMYTPWPDNSDRYALRNQLVNLIGDYIYFAPSHQVTDFHSQVAPVYMYEFAHKSRKASLYSTADWMGVVHADNKPYDFGIPWLPEFFSAYDDADRNVSLYIMTMYANFARSGDPTVSGVAFERYNSNRRAYLRVDVDPKMKASFNPRRMSFWNDYHPELVQLFDNNRETVNLASVVTIETVLKVVPTLIFMIY